MQERFIPFTKREIISSIKKEKNIPEKDINAFTRMLESIYHFRFHKLLEELKETYNTDAFEEKFITLLDKANYEEVSNEELKKAFEEDSLVTVKLKIDTKDYESIRFFYRGSHDAVVRQKKLFGLKKKILNLEVYDNIVVYTKVKKNSKSKFVKPGSHFLKLFKNVPKNDLETLFPNVDVSMHYKDLLMISVPALAGGIPLLLKMLPAIILLLTFIAAYFGITSATAEDPSDIQKMIAAISAIGAVVGYVLQQIMKYKNKKYKFQKQLSDNLYFKNLDNNEGVFFYILDKAEEEEVKEAFLAYYFLLIYGPEEDKKLDEKIEEWFRKKHDCSLDFEIDDALQKLLMLRIAKKKGRKYDAVPLKQALRIMDKEWDNYFKY
jgi:hypothetical protein